MRAHLSQSLLCLVLLGAGSARAQEAAASTDSAATTESSATSTSDESAKEDKSVDERGDGNVRGGELTSAGATTLQTRGTRVGLRVGASKIGQVFYLAGSAEFDLAIKKFNMGLGLPVQIPVFDPSKGLKLFPEGMSLRQQDYARWENFVRLVRYVSYGNKEGDFYLNIAQQYAATIGHGGAVRRYLSNLDVDQAKLSGQLDMKFKYGGFELYSGDLLRPLNMVAGLAYLKPFGGMKNLLLQRFSLGVTYAGDLRAPLELQRDVNGIPVLTDSRAPSPVVAESTGVHVFGVSVETKVVKTESVDIKPYLYADQMAVGGLGARNNLQMLGRGLALGGLGRFGFGEGGKHAFRFILEGRTFENNFMPGYFDSFYEIQRYQYFGASENPASAPTKLKDVMSRDSSLKFGYFAEAQYAWGRHVAFTAAYEDSNAKGGRNMMLHVEVPTFEYVRLFASLYYRGIESNPAQAAAQFGERLKASNTIYFAGARVKVLPILFLNFRAFRSWQIDQANTNNSYRNVNGFQVDAEVGYEFSRR